MATEEPKTLPVAQKVASLAEDEDKAVDESNTQEVNGHSKVDEEKPKPDDKPIVNGKADSLDSSTATVDDSFNRKAFAANNTLPEQAPSETTVQPQDSTDTDMPDINGNSATDAHPSAPEEKIEEAVDPATSKQAPAEGDGSTNKDEAPSDPAPEPAKEPAVDPMDVDSSTERVDAAPNASGENNAQEKPDAVDASLPESSQESSQPSANLAKLNIESAQSDTSMPDQPLSASKVSREREDDGGDERAAKRARVEEDSNGPTADSTVVASVLPSAPAPNNNSDESADDQSITPFHNKLVRQALASIKKTKNGLNFKNSVEKLWPGLWDDYKAKIEKPVDISLFETKLREEKYRTYRELKEDVQLLYQNSLTFNGETNNITLAAGMVKDSLLARIKEISQMEEPAKPEKGKAHPTRHPEPRAATQPRRQSQSQPRAPAQSPKPKPTPTQAAQPTPASSSAQTFAIPPNGIPQIRRDSTREDGDRPKRPIHPPKNRDLDYPSANRKRLEPEQRFFEVVLDEVKKLKYLNLNQWFITPVDPVALNIPTYFSVVKRPMDLGTMTSKNYRGDYKNVKDIEKDMKLIVHNAELFNGSTHDVTILARQLEELFKAELAKRDQWIKKHYPPEVPSTTNASVASPNRSAHDSEDDSEAAEDDGNEVVRNLQVRLGEEQDKLDTLLGSKKPDFSMIEIQQSMVSMLQRKLVEERTKTHGEKKPKPKKKSTKSKPKPSGGGSAGAGNKKAVTGTSAAPKKAPSGNSHKKAVPKTRPVGQLEKAVIAEGINELDGTTLTKAVEIIKRDTGQNENDDGEMELDIDALSMDALRKLYELINKTNPDIRNALEKKPEYSHAAEAEPKAKSGASSKSKKNKPMNKHEQERKIEQLRELKAQLLRHGSGSQEPLPGEIEDNRPADSSDEESDSEEE
ncbi:hypothetical protein M426DRAFT_11412 [Hypoxylon sp. CI-4A]|nr:hypothetical protein M426DRAFT_11412 [Hypoxylon sp. CI-4A]